MSPYNQHQLDFFAKVFESTTQDIKQHINWEKVAAIAPYKNPGMARATFKRLQDKFPTLKENSVGTAYANEDKINTAPAGPTNGKGKAANGEDQKMTKNNKKHCVDKVKDECVSETANHDDEGHSDL